MNCPHLIKWVIESCSADCSPYVPSMYELDGFCRNDDHRKCVHFRNCSVGQDPMRECVAA